MHIESSEYRAVERRNQPARKPKGGGGPGLPEERFFRRAGHGRKPGMKDPRKIGALAAECGHTREAMEIEGYAHTGLRNVLGGLPRAPLADSLCPGLTSGCTFGARKGSIAMRGSMGRIRWGFGPGCRWDGKAVRQRAETRGQRSDEGCDFVLEDIGGELLMSRDCPECGRRAGTRRGGVKAVPMHRDRSPSPGGITARFDEHERGHHRGVREAAGGWRLPRWRRLPNLHGVLRCQEVWPSPGKATPQTPFENPGIYRMGLDVLAVRCSGRM